MTASRERLAEMDASASFGASSEVEFSTSGDASASFAPTAAPSRTRRDVEHQLAHDRNRDGHQAALLARMGAVLTAQEALAAREQGAAYALRQSLVDLAAAAELVAEE